MRIEELRSLEDLPSHKLIGLLGPGNRLRETNTFPVTKPLQGNYVYMSNSAAAQLATISGAKRPFMALKGAPPRRCCLRGR